MTTPQFPQQPPQPPPEWAGQPAAQPQPWSGDGAPGMPPPPPPFGYQPQGAPAGGVARGGRIKSILIALGVIVGLAVLVVAVGSWISHDEPNNAKVGDCLAGKTGDTLKIAKCGDSKATFKVVGKIDSVLQAEVSGNPEICKAYPTALNTFWQGEKGQKGYALCLEPIEK